MMLNSTVTSSFESRVLTTSRSSRAVFSISNFHDRFAASRIRFLFLRTRKVLNKTLAICDSIFPVDFCYFPRSWVSLFSSVSVSVFFETGPTSNSESDGASFLLRAPVHVQHTVEILWNVYECLIFLIFLYR